MGSGLQLWKRLRTQSRHSQNDSSPGDDIAKFLNSYSLLHTASPQMDDYELDRVGTNNPALTEATPVQRQKSRRATGAHAATSGSQDTVIEEEEDVSKYDVYILRSQKKKLNLLIRRRLAGVKSSETSPRHGFP